MCHASRSAPGGPDLSPDGNGDDDDKDDNHGNHHDDDDDNKDDINMEDDTYRARKARCVASLQSHNLKNQFFNHHHK